MHIKRVCRISLPSPLRDFDFDLSTPNISTRSVAQEANLFSISSLPFLLHFNFHLIRFDFIRFDLI